MKRKPTRRQVVRDEFEGVELGDERRSKRARHIADRLAASPDASLPDAMRDRAGTEALYRHLESDDVTIDSLLAPHLALTTERVRRAGLAFAISDTTTFKFGGDADREGLGPINTTDQGFLTHVTLAVAADGTRTPLGVLGVENWVRASKKMAKRPVSESKRWLRGMEAAQERAGSVPLIHVADRESDIYELLAALASSSQRFIVRAAQDRTLVPSEGDERRLFDAVRCEPIAFTMEVPLSARRKKGNAKQDNAFPSRRSRAAQLSFAARAVTLSRPERCARTLPAALTVNVVHVLELGPPVGEPPVEWVLLTSEPIGSEKDISFVVDGYRTRWVIEELFKTTKTGCAFESKQLESFHTLTNLLAYVLVVAYAMLLLRASSRTGRDEPAGSIFTDKQLALLRAVTRKLPAKPTVREALFALAGLGGHLKNNGDPGWRTLSKGWRKLLEYETGYDLALALGTLKK
jgi:hypothetical protein